MLPHRTGYLELQLPMTTSTCAYMSETNENILMAPIFFLTTCCPTEKFSDVDLHGGPKAYASK